jgi:hypothetical protein
MYLRTCESLKSANYYKGWVRKLEIREVPRLRKVRKSNKLLKTANLRTRLPLQMLFVQV